MIYQWSSSLGNGQHGGLWSQVLPSLACHILTENGSHFNDCGKNERGKRRGSTEEKKEKRRKRKKEKLTALIMLIRKTVMERYENGKVTLPSRNRIYSFKNEP